LRVIQVFRNRKVPTEQTVLERYGWEVMGRTAYGSTLATSDFQQFFGKRFVTNADVKQAGTFCPQTLDTDILYAEIKANVP
jgi:hypothetical protein